MAEDEEKNLLMEYIRTRIPRWKLRLLRMFGQRYTIQGDIYRFTCYRFWTKRYIIDIE